MSHQMPINSNITFTINLTTSKDYSLRAAEKLRNKRIHGLFVRLQNGDGNKLSRNGNVLAPASIINRYIQHCWIFGPVRLLNVQK